jgi:hypothetical protein
MAPLYGSWVSSFLYPIRRVVRAEECILALAQANSRESDALLSRFHTARPILPRAYSAGETRQGNTKPSTIDTLTLRSSRIRRDGRRTGGDCGNDGGGGGGGGGNTSDERKEEAGEGEGERESGESEAETKRGQYRGQVGTQVKTKKDVVAGAGR